MINRPMGLRGLQFSYVGGGGQAWKVLVVLDTSREEARWVRV